MPRVARIVLPDYPHHIIQRGHNRMPVFVQNADYRFYLESLAELKSEFDCKVYAFCLMTNHVHLVVEPSDKADNLGLLMKRLAGRYTRRINCIERRSGTVWNGRFKSSPIETDTYLLACCRYVELNPVRAGIVSVPEHYQWSSYGHKVGRPSYIWLDEDPCYARLGSTRSERESGYRDWIRSSIPEGEWDFIRLAIQRGHLSGGLRFKALIEQRLTRRIATREPGRPHKN